MRYRDTVRHRGTLGCYVYCYMKEANLKGYILCVFKYMSFWKRQNFVETTKRSVFVVVVDCGEERGK